MKVNLPLFDKNGKSKGQAEGSPEVFQVPVRENLLGLAVTAYLAKKRRGTASALTRAEVSGSTAKPWKQKGTGKARAGTKKSPLWNGGGVHFPPKPRSYAKDTSKREKKESLKSALSMKLPDIFILEDFELKKPSTKEVAGMLKKLKMENVLLVTDKKNEILAKSVNNLQTVKLTSVYGLNVYDVLKYKNIGIFQSALSNVEKFCQPVIKSELRK
ncbi:MAG: 50S ribosomal protein L4 [Candidatus Margulisiibacteriota bacterium]